MTKIRETAAILIIEDDPDIQSFTSRVLELEGYQVLKTEDGDRGIQIALDNQVALILLDLRLPGRDGWSVLAELRSKPALSKIPVVVLSASAGLRQRESALEMGAADYLVKPISAAKLRKTVARILRQKR